MKKGLLLLVLGGVLFLWSLVKSYTSDDYMVNAGAMKLDEDTGQPMLYWLPIIAGFVTSFGIIAMILEEDRKREHKH